MRLRCLRLFFLAVLCFAAVNLFSIDREAFTFTQYDLTVRTEPDQQRLGVRGKITLRNDSSSAQKIAVLQISSSLNWRSIRAGGAALDFVSQIYTSDIDHTGKLSEAIVTLPGAVPPKGSIDLEIGYEGVVVLDATRLTRIGAPEAQANSSDWDQISPAFTGLRGAGYVAWYPIGSEAEDLSDANSLESLGRWRLRESASSMRLRIEVSGAAELPQLIVSGSTCAAAATENGALTHLLVAECQPIAMGQIVPTLVLASYKALERADMTVHYLHGHDAAAAAYADSAEKIQPLIKDWFGSRRTKPQAADLPDADAAPFESGSLLLVPLANLDSKSSGLLASYQLTHAALSSARQWIDEGLAHFAQALYLEQQSGRRVAIDYMATHSVGLTAREKEETAGDDAESARSLVNTTDEEVYRSKAMYVWWMLRQMIGDAALKKALASYQPGQDKEPSYMPRLIQAQTQRDLEWFFDDWVYRDRGLPEFKVASAFTRNTLPDGYMVTITVENSGAAGAEVPLTVKFSGGEIEKRVVVRAKSNGVIRIEVPKRPEEIVVNDGSVPESDTKNNTFKIDAGETGK